MLSGSKAWEKALSGCIQTKAKRADLSAVGVSRKHDIRMLSDIDRKQLRSMRQYDIEPFGIDHCAQLLRRSILLQSDQPVMRKIRVFIAQNNDAHLPDRFDIALPRLSERALMVTLRKVHGSDLFRAAHERERIPERVFVSSVEQISGDQDLIRLRSPDRVKQPFLFFAETQVMQIADLHDRSGKIDLAVSDLAARHNKSAVLQEEQ